MPRRPRPAIELVSDIGSLGFDLQHHSDHDIAEAVAVLRTVNGPMFDWIVRVLSAPIAKDGEALMLGSTVRVNDAESIKT